MSSFESPGECFLSGDITLLKYLLTYKLSQNHFDRLFWVLRGQGEWSNNLEAEHFMADHMRLFIHHAIQPGRGNCVQLDSTLTLTVTSAATAGNDETDVLHHVILVTPKPIS